VIVKEQPEVVHSNKILNFIERLVKDQSVINDKHG